MKYALIGCGRISTNHIKAAMNNQLEIVAVCDVVKEHMGQVLLKHGLEQDDTIKRYTDYHQMLEENDIQYSNGKWAAWEGCTGLYQVWDSYHYRKAYGNVVRRS